MAGRPIARSTAPLAAGLGLAVGLGLALSAASSAASATRKPHRLPPAPTSHEFAPDITASVAKRARPADPVATPAKTDGATLPPPFHLPVAARSRVRDCGLKWQAMKMSGEAGDDIWRDFATRCLADARGPFEAR